jgi:protein MpaA
MFRTHLQYDFTSVALSLSLIAFARAQDAPMIGQGNAPVVITIPPVFKNQISQRSEIFGYSVQHRPLRVYVLENATPAAPRDVTLIFACVHGNETATPGVVEHLRAHLQKHPESVRGRRVLLVPIMNPDGLARRTRRNARNVDINRNYPGTWRRPRRGEGFKSGPFAASEPEAQAMIRLTSKYHPRKIVSIHQPLFCLAYTGERSRLLALAMQRANGYRLTESVGYPTPGGFGGYCDLILQTPVVTLELPWQSAEAAWQHNAKALLAAIALPVE